MSKMIPLHIADQAVAACEKEITKLREENSGLRAAVESHERVDNLIINRLKAEVERLRSSSFVTAVPVEQYERLRKAGDELHHFLIGYIVEMRVSSSYLNKLDDDWNAAKEGKSV